MMLSSSEVEGSGSRSRNISPVTSGGREISLMKLGVMWLAVIPPVEGTPTCMVMVIVCNTFRYNYGCTYGCNSCSKTLPLEAAVYDKNLATTPVALMYFQHISIFDIDYEIYM